MNDDCKGALLQRDGNHHTCSKIDGIDFQIIVEADILVNIFEDYLGREAQCRSMSASLKQKPERTG